MSGFCWNICAFGIKSRCANAASSTLLSSLGLRLVESTIRCSPNYFHVRRCETRWMPTLDVRLFQNLLDSLEGIQVEATSSHAPNQSYDQATARVNLKRVPLGASKNPVPVSTVRHVYATATGQKKVELAVACSPSALDAWNWNQGPLSRRTVRTDLVWKLILHGLLPRQPVARAFVVTVSG